MKILSKIFYGVVALVLIWLLISFIDVNVNNHSIANAPAEWNFFTMLFKSFN